MVLQTFFLISILTLIHCINYRTATAAVFQIPPPSSCNGSIAECNEELEMVMESELSRRILDEARRQITYPALKPDEPVCKGRAGKAYSAGGCVPRSSNPYRRGCSETYGCRSGQGGA